MRIVAARLPAARRAEVLGDLQEGFARRIRRHGLRAAQRWYWSQALRFGVMRPARAPNGVPPRHRTIGEVMDSVWSDIRFAMRTLWRAPGFTGVAVFTIALGIGANTAIFSVVHAALLRPLPYAESDRLVLIWGELTARDVRNFPNSFMTFRDLTADATTLASAGGIVTAPLGLSSDEGDPEQLEVGWVTANFLDVLGVTPAIGRSFRPDDGVPSGTPMPLVNQTVFAPTAALLSDGLWRRRFAADPDVIGRTILLDGTAVEVVGVLPSDFRTTFPPAAGVPAALDALVALRVDYDAAPPTNVLLTVIARLAPGATLSAAQADLQRIATAERERIAAYDAAGFALSAVGFRSDLTEHVRPILLSLVGAVGFVLLIACANVSNLLLARATTREREVAVRSALGGSRSRIVRQLLTESAVLATLGGITGIGLTVVGIELLLAIGPETLPGLTEVRIDPAVLGFAAAATVVAAAGFGAVPALHAVRPGTAGSLRDRGSVGGRDRHTARNTIVVIEVALSVVLLIGAGLMVRTFASLQRTDPGFNPRSTVTFSVNIPATRYPDPEQRTLFAAQLTERLSAVPEFAASAGVPLPLTDVPAWGRYGTEEALADASQFRQAHYRMVLPDYFDVMQTNVLEGRTFTMQDYHERLPVIVIDELLAARVWPGQSAVGQRLLVRLAAPDPVWMEVVGVVENQRQESLTDPRRETVFFSLGYSGVNGPVTWIVRTPSDAGTAVARVRRELAQLDPLLPIARVSTMDDYMQEAMAGTRFALVLIGVFGGLALVLASVGLYGVLAYMVRQRTAEIGVRIAFGARPDAILGMIVGTGVRLAAVGIVIGTVAALGLTRAMASLLVGVTAVDPLTFASVAVTFAVVALAACYLPARRATRIDPLTALRAD